MVWDITLLLRNKLMVRMTEWESGPTVAGCWDSSQLSATVSSVNSDSSLLDYANITIHYSGRRKYKRVMFFQWIWIIAWKTKKHLPILIRFDKSYVDTCYPYYTKFLVSGAFQNYLRDPKCWHKSYFNPNLDRGS